MNIDIPEYVLGILSQGNCRVLVRGGRFYDGENTVVVQDTSGLVSLKEHLHSAQMGTLQLIGLLKSYFKALDAAADWLIPFNAMDFSLGNIWISQADNSVKFCIKTQNIASCCDGAFATGQMPSYMTAAFEICELSQAKNSEIIRDKLKTAAQLQRFDVKSICKMLDLLAERSLGYSLKRELPDDI